MPTDSNSSLLRASPVRDPAKIFFTSKFSHLLFFSTRPIKVKVGHQYRWGDYLPNSKPPGPINMMGESETLTVVRSYLLHSFLEVHNVADPFTSHWSICNYVDPKLFSCWVSQTGIFFWLFFIQLDCAGSCTEHH